MSQKQTSVDWSAWAQKVNASIARRQRTSRYAKVVVPVAGAILFAITIVWWNPFTWFVTPEKEPVVRTPRAIGGRPEPYTKPVTNESQ